MNFLLMFVKIEKNKWRYKEFTNYVYFLLELCFPPQSTTTRNYLNLKTHVNTLNLPSIIATLGAGVWIVYCQVNLAVLHCHCSV